VDDDGTSALPVVASSGVLVVLVLPIFLVLLTTTFANAAGSGWVAALVLVVISGAIFALFF
jgi:hypothetical protein